MNSVPKQTYPSIDLRSDTVTLPTEAMMTRMAAAQLGDDGLDHDPTAAHLEEVTARLLGKEAGLYVPSCTMANLLAVLAQTDRGDQIVTDSGSHISNTEKGIAIYGAISLRTLPSRDGEMDPDQLEDLVERETTKIRTPLICLETSHNSAGGTVPSLDYMAQVREIGGRFGAAVHLDGARLFNAAAALEIAPTELCASVDTVSICLSKGLSAPLGAVLVGSETTIKAARHLRKSLGGTQRQVGLMAATGLEAVEVMRHRLGDDHETARILRDVITTADTRLLVSPAVTNIIQVDTTHTGTGANQWVSALQERGIAVRAMGRSLIRCVTHRHIDPSQAEAAAHQFLELEKVLQHLQE